jgi:CheY-like chemotaxis protein
MILFLDDEASPNDFYLADLTARHLPVTAMTDLGAAWTFLSERSDVRAVVLDVMMPPGTLFTLADTKQGLLTGVSFYRMLRAKFPMLPVFVLTNNTDPAIAAALQGDRHADLSEKTMVWSDDFAEKVGQACLSTEAAEGH